MKYTAGSSILSLSTGAYTMPGEMVDTTGYDEATLARLTASGALVPLARDITPAAADLAALYADLDLSTVEGSGAEGRITVGDINAAVAARELTLAAPPAPEGE